jgi:hypothetical protein
VSARFVKRGRIRVEKLWEIVENSGQCVVIESESERKTFRRPSHIVRREFLEWFRPGTSMDDVTLQHLLTPPKGK